MDLLNSLGIMDHIKKTGWSMTVDQIVDSKGTLTAGAHLKCIGGSTSQICKDIFI